MYCGSCMHDNSLAKALSAEGWETTLVPTYTPIRTDETDVSVDQVFFGGINIYLQQKIPLFRHLPGVFDKLLNSPRLIRRVTSRGIQTKPQLLGELTVSMLRGSAGYQKKEVRRLVAWLSEDPRPDRLVLSNILIGGFLPELKRQFPLPVAVTLQGDDIFLKSLPEPYQSRSRELIAGLDRHVDAYLVHSRFYADEMADYLGLSREKMHVTPLGIDTRDFAALEEKFADPGKRLTIGYLARLSPEKGLEALVDAFILLKKKPGTELIHLRIAGWLGSDHVEFANRMFRRLDDAGLGGAFRHDGSLTRSQKMDFLSSIDVLTVPATYHEPKGLYVLEAMAAGVPCVQPDHGVFPELIADLGGGLLFPAVDPAALAEKWHYLAQHPGEITRMGTQGRKNVLQRRNAGCMAKATIEVLDSL
jgi:glycosyltransferase involved in cell wall biosynthesis